MRNSFLSSFDTRPSDLFSAPNVEHYSDILLPDLKHALYRLIDVYSFDAGSVYLPVPGKPNTFEIKESIGFSDSYLTDTKEIRSGFGFCGTALGLNEIRVTEDTANDSRYTRPLIKEIGFKSFAAIPLHPEIGLINLASYKQRTFTSSELSMFAFIGHNLGALCYNRLLLYDAMNHIQINNRLSVFSKELLEVRDINQIALLVVEECRTGLSCPSSFLLFKSDELSFIRSAGIKKETLTDSFKKHLENYSQEKDLYVLSAETSDKDLKEFLQINNLQFLYCFNIEGQSGYIGILAVGVAVKSGGLRNNQLDAFKRMVRQLRATIERYLYNRQLTTLAILEEQNRISRELHDSMAQQIVAIQKQSEYMQSIISGKNSIPDTIDKEFRLMFEMLGDLYADVREIISGLRTFESSGSFESSLKHYLAYYQQNNPIQVSFSIESNLKLPQFIQLQVLRIIQEALSNVRKHSNAQHVSISIVKETDGLNISIKDDGVGFDTNDQSPALQRFGLAMMRERAESVKGQLHIRSSPDQGTYVQLYLPSIN